MDDAAILKCSLESVDVVAMSSFLRDSKGSSTYSDCGTPIYSVLLHSRHRLNVKRRSGKNTKANSTDENQGLNEVREESINADIRTKN